MSRPLRVAHLVDAMGGTKHLWGKENVLHRLMRAQRASGDVEPQLIVFAPCLLAEIAEQDGFPVHVLGHRHHRFPFAALRAMRGLLPKDDRVVLHTHDYKANIVGRLARLSRIPMASLVSSCYGWINETRALVIYQTLDRWTAGFSFVATAPDREMLRQFPGFVHTEYVPNGIPDRAPPTADERAAARAAFGWTADTFVVGTLGRLSPEKGVNEYLEAARRSTNPHVVWAIAGAGPLEQLVKSAEGSAIRFTGYVESTDAYFAAIDAFVQPSRTEGLSLSLLEAMRAQLPIVATAVGATGLAVRHEREAFLVAPRDPDQLVAAVERLEADRDGSRQLAAAARTRFVEMWRIEAQHQAFYELYLGSLAGA